MFQNKKCGMDILFSDQKPLQWVRKPEDYLEVFKASKMKLFFSLTPGDCFQALCIL